MLDEFGSLQTIPLDQYDARVFSFDPRNDGYAVKLREVFVHDGKRYVYMPLKAGNWSAASLDRQFAGLLGDITFSIEYLGIGKPLPFLFVSYAAASLLFVLFCFVRKKAHNGIMQGIAPIFAILPVLSCFAFFGACGFAAAALFLGLFVCLREPASELVKHLSSNNRRNIKLIFKDAIAPYKAYRIFLAVFSAVMAVIVVFSELKLSLLLLTFAASLLIFLLAVKTMSLWVSGKRRFVPVMIIRRRIPDFSFSMYMAPFAAAALVVMLITPFMAGSYKGGGNFSHFIDENDYYAHLAFQSTFSTRQLGGEDSSYPAYVSGEDGLPVADSKAAVQQKIKFNDYPPFPVKHLMDFLKSFNSGGKAAPVNGGSGILENLPLFLLLLLILIGLLFNEKITFSNILLPVKGRFNGFKKFTGMFRRTGINRKKVVLYNGKNNFRIRKDA